MGECISQGQYDGIIQQFSQPHFQGLTTALNGMKPSSIKTFNSSAVNAFISSVHSHEFEPRDTL